MNTLNPRQKQAVNYIDGPCLVLAGAGSGKTSVITRKIAYLIESCGFKAHNIAALTFTNKAAREMKERVGKLVQQPGARGLTVSTFHNLGLSIIRKHHREFGFKQGFSIFDSEDSHALLKELTLKDQSETDTDQIRQIQTQISNWKNDLTEPDIALSRAASPEEQVAAIIYQRYTQALKAYNAVDFDDLILLPVQKFTADAELLARWQRQIRYLLVDEYQDTNGSQYQLIKLMMGDRGALTVVGDDDQSIYAWRGARPENLTILKEDFPSLEVIKLEQNYRSTQRILKAANHLIDHNPHEFDKKLWSDRGYGEPIKIIFCDKEDAEAERIATEIISQRLNRSAQYRDFAVLYRSNHQARLIEMKLQHYQVPYALSGGTSFFSRAEIKDIMAYLRLIVNPDDDNALLRIINTPRRQLGTSTIEQLGQYATERDISLFAAAGEMGMAERLSPQSLQRLQKFTAWIEHITRECEEGEPMAALREMLEDMDYVGWLHQNASTPTAAERRYENVQFLLGNIDKTLQQQREETLTETPDISLKDAIAKLMLMDLLEQQEEEDDSDRVQLMTLHASKGLEYPHVLLAGFEEELLPHRNSIEDDFIEEERRLTYVGITRAQKTLTLTLTKKRKQYGETIETTPSRFLEELPQDDLEFEGKGGEVDEAANRSKGLETLDNLLDMFD